MAAQSTKSGKQKSSTPPIPTTQAQPGNRNEGILDAIKTLSSAAQKAIQYSSDISKFDNLTLEIRTLKADLAEKVEESEKREKKLEEAETENRLLTDRFSKKAAQLLNEKEQQKSNLEAIKTQYRESSTKHVQTTKKNKSKTPRTKNERKIIYYVKLERTSRSPKKNLSTANPNYMN
jgi:arginine deiminase